MENNLKIANPTKYYIKPLEVQLDNSLTKEEKIKLLLNWLDDIKLKQIAEEENMIASNDGHKNYSKELNDLLAFYNN